MLFVLGQNFWPQLEINETSNFSQTNSVDDKIEGICSQFKKYFTFIIYMLTVTKLNLRDLGKICMAILFLYSRIK